MDKKALTPEAARFVESAAHERDWFLLADMLRYAQLDPHHHGFSHHEDVLIAVAEARRQHPGALRGPIAARMFLEELESDHGIQIDEIHCGFSQIEVLRRIKMADSNKALDLVADVLKGRYTTEALRDIQKKLVLNRPSIGNRPLQTHKKRAVEFEKTVNAFVKEHPQLLSIPLGSQICDGPVPPLINADLVVVCEGKPVMAIEAKRTSPNAYRRQIYEAVGLCALALKRVPNMWVISPMAARQQLEKMDEVAKEFGLDGARFACLDEDAATGAPDTALHLIGVAAPAI